jgi:hypothetical protein
MMHLSDEEMIEHAYLEGPNQAACDHHMAGCRECADSFVELQRDLSAIKPLNAPARDDRYGERVWASIAPSLPAYAPTPATRPSIRDSARMWFRGWLWKGLASAAVCALVASAAFYAGRQFEQKKQHPVAQLPAKQAPARQPIVVVVLDDHLDRSERFLVQLKHADLDSAAMATPMRDEARQLLAANKICHKNVTEKSDPELNTALDHLDRLLADAANAPGGLNAQSIARLQNEMNADGLLFEVRVLRSRIGRPKANTSSQGGTI